MPNAMIFGKLRENERNVTENNNEVRQRAEGLRKLYNIFSLQFYGHNFRFSIRNCKI